MDYNYTREHPEWCDYPVENKHSAIIDCCWGVLSGKVKKQGKKHCSSCCMFKTIKER